MKQIYNCNLIFFMIWHLLSLKKMKYEDAVYIWYPYSQNNLSNFQFRFRNTSRPFRYVNKRRKENKLKQHSRDWFCHHEFIRENSVDSKTTDSTSMYTRLSFRDLKFTDNFILQLDQLNKSKTNWWVYLFSVFCCFNDSMNILK